MCMTMRKPSECSSRYQNHVSEHLFVGRSVCYCGPGSLVSADISGLVDEILAFSPSTIGLRRAMVLAYSARQPFSQRAVLHCIQTTVAWR